MVEGLKNLYTDNFESASEELNEEDILFDETLDNLGINKESGIFKEQMGSFPRLRYRFTIEKGDTLGSIIKNKILINYPELTDQDRQNWALIKQIIELIKDSNNIENENQLEPGTKISVKKRKVLKIVNDYLRDHTEIVRLEHRNYIELKSIEDFVSLKREPLINRLYNDSNIKPEIEKALNDGQTVLIPSYTENRDTQNFENINDIIQPKEKLGEELKGKTFEIDPGHGFQDPGAIGLVSYGDPSENTKIVAFESAIAMDMAYRVGMLLKAHGANVEFTHYIPTRGISDIKDLAPCLQYGTNGGLHQDKRTDQEGNTTGTVGQTTSINTRYKMTNKDNPNMFISIHMDSADPDKKNNLVLVDINDKAYKDSESFAAYLESQGIGDVKVRGKNKDSLGVLRESTCPSVLIELGNIKNTNDAYRFRDPKLRQQKAEEIVNATVNYYVNKK